MHYKEKCNCNLSIPECMVDYHFPVKYLRRWDYLHYHIETEVKYPLKYCSGTGEREINTGNHEVFRTTNTLKSALWIILAK